ncbi:MAG: hypothetical protein H5T86_11920, partial [Armatimonadetes bacterium]|nr:hypothetical protein [Armatimonadota bacterium]
SVWAELAPHGTETAWYLQDHFNMLGEALIRLNYDFDYVSEEMLWTAEVIAGELVIRDESGSARERFKAVILPALTTISRRTAEALAKIAASGVPVIATGTLPTRSSEQGEDEELRRRLRALFGDAYDQSLTLAQVVEPALLTDIDGAHCGTAVVGLPPRMGDDVLEALGSVLTATVYPDIRIRLTDGRPATDVIHYHWRRDGTDFYVLHNTSRERGYSVVVSPSVDGAPTVWDPDTGEVTPAPVVRRSANRIEIPLDLPPVGTLVVGIQPGAEPVSRIVATAPAVQVTSVSKTGADGLVFGSTEPWVEVARPDGTVRRVTASAPPLPETIELNDEWSFRTLKPNALPLTEWRMEMDNRVTGRDHAHPNTVFTTSFVCDIIPQDARLLIDGLAVEKVLGGSSRVEFEVFLNGTRIERWERGSYLDHHILEADVGSLLKKGDNEVVVRTGTIFVEMPMLRYPMILFGRFALGRGRRPRIIAEPQCITCRGWERHGYPYYSGIAVYSKTVRLSSAHLSCRLLLELSKVADAAEVVVNGRSCGARAWEPWRFDITDAAVAGDNLIEIRVANSMQNLIVQEPKPSGLLGPARVIPAAAVHFAFGGGD